MQTLPYDLLLDGSHVYQPVRLTEKPRLNEEIVEWCDANLDGKWLFDFIISAEHPFQMFFEDENERLLFKLRWIG